jgi:hypothetical protein
MFKPVSYHVKAFSGILALKIPLSLLFDYGCIYSTASNLLSLSAFPVLFLVWRFCVPNEARGSVQLSVFPSVSEVLARWYFRQQRVTKHEKVSILLSVPDFLHWHSGQHGVKRHEKASTLL